MQSSSPGHCQRTTKNVVAAHRICHNMSGSTYVLWVRRVWNVNIFTHRRSVEEAVEVEVSSPGEGLRVPGKVGAEVATEVGLVVGSAAAAPSKDVVVEVPEEVVDVEVEVPGAGAAAEGAGGAPRGAVVERAVVLATLLLVGQHLVCYGEKKKRSEKLSQTARGGGGGQSVTLLRP